MRIRWPSVFTGARQFVSDTFPPELDPVHFVASEGELLISYATIIRVDIEHAGNFYNSYGFGNMLTFPSFREKGIGGQVLGMATEHIKYSKVDISMLFCDPQRESFYGKRGWKITRSPTRIGSPNQHKNHDLTRMMLFLSEKARQGIEDFNEEPVYVDEPW